ncbi:MAG: PilZ domain-containing protein [Candidatus Omnitrophica bacterium]|nr:PilZ domain-containing protein [Candidatus Omnitrophota bacterium]
MKNVCQERRKYPRYDTEVKIFFHVTYDIKTKVKFKVLVGHHKGLGAHKYSGLSKNVSVEGLGFVSHKKLEKGDLLFIEVYEPKMKAPVKMEGQVRWSRKLPDKENGKDLFHTGVRVILVNDKLVADTISFEKKYNVMWSAVLQSLFGSFAAMLRKTSKSHKLHVEGRKCKK